jgi:hypothetical protein
MFVSPGSLLSCPILKKIAEGASHSLDVSAAVTDGHRHFNPHCLKAQQAYSVEPAPRVLFHICLALLCPSPLHHPQINHIPLNLALCLRSLSTLYMVTSPLYPHLTYLIVQFVRLSLI